MYDEKDSVILPFAEDGKDAAVQCISYAVVFGGLLGFAPIMPVNKFSAEEFIARGGRIPAPMHSLRN